MNGILRWQKRMTRGGVLAIALLAMSGAGSIGCTNSSAEAESAGKVAGDTSTAKTTDSAMSDEASEKAASTNSEQADNSAEKTMEKATFGGGCFWGVELTFSQLKGVTKTEVGFMGGKIDNPSYKQVCYTDTGHAEVVHLEYDPSVISYEELLDTFWKIHDPTQVNRQGPDVGSQYRTVIFYHSDAQREKAEASKKELDASGKFRKPIATKIEAADTFWKAEDYHQKYLEKRGATSCHLPNG